MVKRVKKAKAADGVPEEIMEFEKKCATKWAAKYAQEEADALRKEIEQKAMMMLVVDGEVNRAKLAPMVEKMNAFQELADNPRIDFTEMSVEEIAKHKPEMLKHKKR